MELKTTQFIDHIIEYCDQQFPMSCSACGREFSSFGNFVRATFPVAEPIAYETVDEFLEVRHPIGSLSYVNCGCGNTLAVHCGDTTSDDYLALLRTLASDVERTGLTVSGVFEVLRQEIRSRFTSRSVNTPDPGNV